MSRLTRDGTAEPISRDQVLRHARGQGNIYFPCSADHEQDWQPYPVDPYSAICDDHTYCCTSKYVYSVSVIVCVFVCVFSSHLFWTSSSLDVLAGVTQEEGHTGGKSHRISYPPCFCGPCLNFFSREDFSHSFPSSPVKSNFVY